jgi:F420-dependent oxidoreductase-like protein
VWLGHWFQIDALTALAVAGREVQAIGLGTFIVPTYPRHPLTPAGQALATQAACRNRLILGIGVSHQMIIEGVFGYSFDKPARHLREYLSVLMPALHTGEVSFTGQALQAHTIAPVSVAGAEAPPVLLAALGPVMLKLAGELADGTVTWMAGPKTLGGHIVPSITKAASAAGRPSPRIAVGLPVCVAADADAARQQAASTFALYSELPGYHATFEREQARGPADLAIVGDEAAVTSQLENLINLGATEIIAHPFGTREQQRRTTELLGTLASQHK